MFACEAEMVAPAVKWLESLGLMVKTEFTIPWGICDLAGVSMDKHRVSERLGLGQIRPVGSVTRATILFRIPDVESRRSVTLGKLVRDCAPAMPEEMVVRETERLLADRFVVWAGRNRLQKLNGWAPLQKRLIALELKLSRVKEAMSQAVNNLGFAGESYVGLPADVARRVLTNRQRWAEEFNEGIGLVAVTRRSCSVLIAASSGQRRPEPALEFYCVEKFWRTYPKGSSASTARPPIRASFPSSRP